MWYQLKSPRYLPKTTFVLLFEKIYGEKRMKNRINYFSPLQLIQKQTKFDSLNGHFQTQRQARERQTMKNDQ